MHTQVDTLLTSLRVMAVGIVGSSAAADHIHSIAAAHGKRAQCFGGAKNHMIIMPDADNGLMTGSNGNQRRRRWTP